MDTNHTIDRVIAGYRDQRDAAMAERDALRAQVRDLADGQIAHAAAAGRVADELRAQVAELAAALRHLDHDLIVERATRTSGTLEHGTAERLRAERELLAPHFGDVPGSAAIQSGLSIARAALAKVRP